MTLILARASAKFVLQVSDRLVTQNQRPYDRVANKTILCLASDAVVAMSYTGDAYVGDIPTDHWLAEKLIRRKIDPGRPKAFYGGRNASCRDIGWSIHVLQTALTRENQALRNRLKVNMAFSGWRWNVKGRPRPYIAFSRKIPGQQKWGTRFEPRHFHYERQARTYSAPRSIMSRQELEQLKTQLRGRTALEAEAMLVAKIREVSRRNPLVGPHCMSILLPPPPDPDILVRYLPATTSSEPGRPPADELVWTYSPWIVGPNICKPPSKMAGPVAIGVRQYTIHHTSTAPMHPDYRFAVFGQKRPRLRTGADPSKED